MTNTPGHDHPAEPWRTSQNFLNRLRSQHPEGCEHGPECMGIVAAEAADLMVETIECQECRPAIYALIEHLITDGNADFNRELVLALVTTLAGADRKINEGIKTYEQMVGSN